MPGRVARAPEAAPPHHLALELELELNSVPPRPHAHGGGAPVPVPVPVPVPAAVPRVRLLPNGRAYAVGPGRWLLPAPNASVRRVALCSMALPEGAASLRMVRLALLVLDARPGRPAPRRPAPPRATAPRPVPRAEGGGRRACGRGDAAQLSAERELRWWRRACLALGATQVLGLCWVAMLLARRGRPMTVGRELTLN